MDIDLAAFKKNLIFLRHSLASGSALLAVVKANAYGHGVIRAAQAAIEAGAVYLGVTSVEEGALLRHSGIQVPILVLGSLYPFEHASALFDQHLTPTVASVETAEALNRLALSRQERLSVHLKVDSGFGRMGVSAAHALPFILKASALPGLLVEGIYTHFSSSDVDPEWTRQQASVFKEVIRQAREAGVAPRFVHMANSAAVLHFPDTHGTLVRPGLALYGIVPDGGSESRLVPVMSWKSRIVFLKQWPEGGAVSYARTWTAKRPSRIATLAVGYADGYPRILSNHAFVLLRGRRVPVIGRITMDMIMVDVTDVGECQLGDEVVLIGAQGADQISATEIAGWAQTNSYEILSRISERVPRVYHG